MALQEQKAAFVEAFFQEIKPAHEHNKNLTLSYIAVRQDGEFHLIQGALFFNSGRSNIAATHFMSANVRAGNYALSSLVSVREEFASLESVSGGVEVVDSAVISYRAPLSIR